MPINILINIPTHIIAYIINNIGNNINTYCDPSMDSKKTHANENCIGSYWRKFHHTLSGQSMWINIGAQVVYILGQ